MSDFFGHLLPSLPERGFKMATRANQPTNTRMGRRWATATLFFCGAFSLWANVRSGQFEMENAVVSAMPPGVAFLTSHLIGYFNPRKIGHKVLIWGVGGLITLFSMGASAVHIIEYTMRFGQPWYTAAMYVFVVDAPMLLAGVILIQKVPATAKPAQTVQTQASSVQKATKPTPVKKPTKTAKATPKPQGTLTPQPTIVPAFSEA